VFHFDFQQFGAAIQNHPHPQKFCYSRGMKKGSINFCYSDILAIEILMGSYSGLPTTLENFNEVVIQMNALVERFVAHAEELIRLTLVDLGFTLKLADPKA
jgi:hypothetical protein